MIKASEALSRFSPATLRAVASSLREGPLALGITKHGVRHLVGPQREIIYDYIQEYAMDGMAPRHIAMMLDSIAGTIEHSPDPAILFELVLSGPDIPGVPSEDTAAALQMLINEAQQEILLVGYAVYKGERIFEPVATKLRKNPTLKVTFCLDISRKMGDTSLDSEIVRRFAIDFRQKHWPWAELPDLFYAPRSLSESLEEKVSLHAKCVVVDRCTALITSANFTEAAHRRNIEVGMLVRYAPIAERIADYFRGLQASGLLIQCPLK